MESVIFDSPLGPLHICAEGGCIVQLKIGDGSDRTGDGSDRIGGGPEPISDGPDRTGDSLDRIGDSLARIGHGPDRTTDGPERISDSPDRISDGREPNAETRLLARAIAQLAAYFEGSTAQFDLPLVAPQSPFQGKVRAAMLAIPFGQTRSYGDIAKAIGGVPRAVGQACGRNPIPIIVPYHRVLAAGGAIGGFSGGDGQPTKRKLLAHEAGPIFAIDPHSG
jgi:methylated-DNA-[protein]-cysteine S-methyltransferase